MFFINIFSFSTHFLFDLLKLILYLKHEKTIKKLDEWIRFDHHIPTLIYLFQCPITCQRMDHNAPYFHDHILFNFQYGET
jgi:hypothetical protein